jgi:hypothetical protein
VRGLLTPSIHVAFSRPFAKGSGLTVFGRFVAELSSAQRSFAECLQVFTFECIGGAQTDDEQVICKSLSEFGKLIVSIEEERDRMLENVYSHVVKPLEDFRKKCIGGVKNEKKKFEKQTAKFCQCQERYLNLTTKKPNSLQEVCFVFNLECVSRFERVLHETRHRIFAGLGTCKISTSHLRRKCLFWASNKTKK